MVSRHALTSGKNHHNFNYLLRLAQKDYKSQTTTIVSQMTAFCATYKTVTISYKIFLDTNFLTLFCKLGHSRSTEKIVPIMKRGILRKNVKNLHQKSFIRSMANVIKHFTVVITLLSA